MKKIYNLLYVLLGLTVYTSCAPEVDDVFDKSSAERMEEALLNDKQLLTDAPNGWLIEYYGESTYGGYNMFVKFNADNTATVANEVYGAEARSTSHYKLEQSKGVVLSFDEHNELFHFFSDPKNPAGVGDNGKGMNGDFEFRIVKADKDTFLLEGKKHGQRITMTRADNVDWAEYIDAVAEMESHAGYNKYELTGGSEPMTLKGNYRTLIYHDAETDKDVTLPYIITPNGLKMKKPVPYNGTEINAFTPIDGDAWTAEGNPSFVLAPVVPPLSEQFADQTKNWSFVQGRMSSKMALYFKQAENGSEAEGEEIVFMAMGYSSNANGWGLYFRSGNFAGLLKYNCTIIDDTHVSLAFALSGDSNGVYYYNNCGYNYVTTAIGNSSGATYEITTDNAANPSYLRLTRTDAGSFQNEWFELVPGLDYYVQE